MRKYKSLFFSVLIFLTACSGDKIPKDIIEPEQMVPLLIEVHITDGGMYNVAPVPDSLYKYGVARYEGVFKKFHTDSITFKKSFKYYTVHPEYLAAIYEHITVILKQKMDSLTKLDQARIQRDTKRRADSIKRIPPAQRKADSIKKMELAKKREDSLRKVYQIKAKSNSKFNKKFNRPINPRVPI